MSLREVLERRKTIILDKPAIKALEEIRLAAKVRPRILEGSPLFSRQVIGVGGVDTGLDSMKEGKRREWRERGYPEGLINMAITLSDEWTQSMASAFAPPELKEAVMRHVYPKALEVGQKWIESMTK